MSAAPRSAAPRLPAQPALAPSAPGVGGRRQRVCVPWRIVAGAQYADVALTVYVKVAALAARAEGCTAGTAVLADYLGMSKSSVERGLRQLATPDEVDGLVEVPTRRRTLPGGRGTTAHRAVRALEGGEDFVWLPVGAAETLTPRQLRAYAVLAYADARRIPMAAADLADYLRHQSGRSAGEPVGERQARRVIDDLDTTGWLDVDRRAGHQGRHAYAPHRTPLHTVPATASAEPCPDIHDGSGPDIHDGSLASKEDLATDRRCAGAAGGIRRRRGDRSRAVATPGENPQARPDDGDRALRADAPIFPTTNPACPPTYTGPALSYSPRLWHILEPVRHLMTDLRPYVQRQIGRAISQQLEAGTDPERLRLRLQTRYAHTEHDTIRDAGRWLLGAGLPRWGCGLQECETGVLWTTGARCVVCQDIVADRRAGQLQPAGTGPAPASASTWSECRGCGAPSRTDLPGGLCRPCRPTAAPAA